MKRNILLNPGPSTTTDTVKMAQVVPDICPREQEFASMMKGIREDLVKIVHGDSEKYTSVLFCGSGTINIDVCLNSLLPENKKILIVNNGAYSTRAVEICEYYGLPHIHLQFPVDRLPDLDVVDRTLRENPDIALVHTTHNETGTGILNPIREIGALAHQYGATFTVDTTSTLAMRPIDIEKDNIDLSKDKGFKLVSKLSESVTHGNRKKEWDFNKDAGMYVCPAGQMAKNKRKGGTQKDKNGVNTLVETYFFNVEICKSCPMREGCYKEGAKTKTYSVKIKSDIHTAQMDYMKTDEFKNLYAERYKIEAKNAELKNTLDYGKAHGCGMLGMTIQAAVSLFLVNLKRIETLEKGNNNQQ